PRFSAARGDGRGRVQGGQRWCGSGVSGPPWLGGGGRGGPAAGGPGAAGGGQDRGADLAEVVDGQGHLVAGGQPGVFLGAVADGQLEDAAALAGAAADGAA